MSNRDMLNGQLNRMAVCKTREEFVEHHEWAKHWLDAYTMEKFDRFEKKEGEMNVHNR